MDTVPFFYLPLGSFTKVPMVSFKNIVDFLKALLETSRAL